MKLEETSYVTSMQPMHGLQRLVEHTCAKAFAVAAPMLRLAPVIQTTKGLGRFCVEGARDGGMVL